MNDPCHPADHEWDTTDGYTETCDVCGETRDYDGTPPDDRDFSHGWNP